MQHGLISNLHITSVKQHFAHTISQTWQSVVKKKKKKKVFKLASVNVKNRFFCCFMSSMPHLIRLIKSYFHVTALCKVEEERKGFHIPGKPDLGLLSSTAETFTTF